MIRMEAFLPASLQNRRNGDQHALLKDANLVRAVIRNPFSVRSRSRLSEIRPKRRLGRAVRYG